MTAMHRPRLGQATAPYPHWDSKLVDPPPLYLKVPSSDVEPTSCRAWALNLPVVSSKYCQESRDKALLGTDLGDILHLPVVWLPKTTLLNDPWRYMHRRVLPRP